jgi:hypothetical protein
MVSEGSISHDMRIEIVCKATQHGVAYECVKHLWLKDHGGGSRRCNSFHFLGPAVQSGNHDVLRFLLQKFRENDALVWTSTYLRVVRGLIRGGHSSLALDVFSNGSAVAKWWSPALFDVFRTQHVIYACWTEAVISMNTALCLAILEAVPEERRSKIMTEKTLEVAMNANRTDVFEHFWNLIPTKDMRVAAGKAVFRQIARNIVLVQTTGALISVPSVEMRRFLVSKIEYRVAA